MSKLDIIKGGKISGNCRYELGGIILEAHEEDGVRVIDKFDLKEISIVFDETRKKKSEKGR